MISKILLSYLFLLSISSDIFSQKFDAEIINYSTFIEVEKDKLIQTDSVTIQINNRIGEEYTDISLIYSKNEKISNVGAWIEDCNGKRVRKLSNKDIVDKSAFNETYLYADYYKKCFQLKHNFYPYKITYTYKTTSHDYITIADWSPIKYPKIPTRFAKLIIDIPKGYQFDSLEQNVPAAKIDSIENRKILEWNASYEKPIIEEIFSQTDCIVPEVCVKPLYFNYGVQGCSKDWQSYGNYKYQLNQGLDILPESEISTLSKLLSGVNEKKEIVKILYHYLQDHTRYINVTIGIGGLKPYPASYVAQNKYGDCKALTNYLKAILSYAGIESYYVEVFSDEQPHELFKNFAGPQFNHVLLCVPIEHDTIWLESANNINPFGFIGTSTQNRDALLICKDNSRLVRLPSLKKEDNLTSNKMEFHLTVNGTAYVTLNSLFKGRQFEMFNQLHSDFNKDEKDQIIKGYMPFDNYEVISWNFNKLDRDSARIELHSVLNLFKYFKPIGKEFYVNLSPIEMPSFSSTENRKLPVLLPYPIYNIDTLIYYLPKGYELKTKPDSIIVKSVFGTYQLKLSIANDKIYAIKSFELFSGNYSLEEYPKFYDFISKVKELDKKKIVFQPIDQVN